MSLLAPYGRSAAKTSLQITFGILNSEDDYIDMLNLIKIVKLTKNVKK